MTNPLLPKELVKNIPLLSAEFVKQIPIEFAPILITGYHIPISFFESPPVILVEDTNKLDEFLDKNPHFIEEIRSVEKECIVEKVT